MLLDAAAEAFTDDEEEEEEGAEPGVFEPPPLDPFSEGLFSDTPSVMAAFSRAFLSPTLPGNTT